MRIVILIFLLTSCVAPKDIYLPDGSKGYSLKCDGATQDISICYAKAGELCGSVGYQILATSKESTPFPTGYFNQYVTVVQRSLLIKCNEGG